MTDEEKIRAAWRRFETGFWRYTSDGVPMPVVRAPEPMEPIAIKWRPEQPTLDKVRAVEFRREPLYRNRHFYGFRIFGRLGDTEIEL
jgi:hypothetical protein